MSLQFSESIIGSAKDPIPTTTLLERLQTLHTELSQANPQNAHEIESFEVIAKQLANAKLIKNNNPGVIAYTCCCICDILRIYAPDAPYTATQLANIFKAIIGVMAKLGDGPEVAYTQQYEYILRSLVDVKSISLITDCGAASADLIESMFITVYGATSKKFDPRVGVQAASLLSEIVAEAETIPHKVMELVLAPFNKTPVAGTTNVGFQLSVSVCEYNVDRMHRLVGQFFSEMLYSEGEQMEQGSKRAHVALEKIHHLCVQLWKYVPELVESVMPLLDDELNADDSDIRVMATRSLGSIIGSSNYVDSQPVTKVNFFVAYPQSWVQWLRKITDGSAAVRTVWTQAIPSILAVPTANAGEVKAQIIRCFHKAMKDANDRVREAAMTALMEISDLAPILEDGGIDTVLHECRDKNSSLRQVAINVAGTLFKQDLAGTESIPSALLNLSYINDRFVDAQVDLAWSEYIVSFDEITINRVARLLAVWHSFDQRAKDAFLAMLKRQRQMSPVMNRFIEMGQHHARSPDGDDDNVENVAKVVQWFCDQLPQEWKPKDSLLRFYRKATPRHWFLLAECLNDASPINTIRRSLAELEQKITDEATRNCIKILVLRSAQIVFNVTNVAEVITQGDTAGDWLVVMSENAPTMVENHVEDLWDRVTMDVTSGLRPLLHYGKAGTDFSIPESKLPVLVYLAQNGSPDAASDAVEIMTIAHKPLALRELVANIHDLDPSEQNFTAHLAAWAQLVRDSCDLVQPYATEVTSVLIRKVLVVHPTDLDSDEVILRKRLALQIMANRLLGLANDGRYSKDELEVQAKPVLQLLTSLIGHQGEIIPESSEDYPTPARHRQQLRSLAGELVLTLAESPTYDSLISVTTLRRLTVLLIDKEPEVRHRFLSQLNHRIMTKVIDRRFIALSFYTAFEADKELAAQNRSWIQSLFKRQTSHKWEKTLATVVYFLAHDEKFNQYLHEDDERLPATPESETTTRVMVSATNLLHGCQYVAIVLRYFIDLIAHGENISLLYYLASRIKQYRDTAVAPEVYKEHPLPLEARKLYIVAETAQYLLSKKAEEHNWVLLSWTQKIKLDESMYTSMSTIDEVRDVITTVFVPEAIQHKLDKSRRTRAPKRIAKSKATKPAKRIKVAEQPTRRSIRGADRVDYHETTTTEVEDSD